MDRVEKMKYAVDRIINNIAVLESLENQEKKEVPLKELPEDLKEGNIILYENNIYFKDIVEETKRITSIKSKFDMLRKK
jgi:hypothetical protein